MFSPCTASVTNSPMRSWRGHRRVPWMFAPLMFWGAIALLSMLFHTRTLPFVAVAVVALGIGFIFAFRRASGFFRAQDRLRRQLMADVAHELRTPLTILQGRVEGMTDGVYPRDDAQIGGLLDEVKHLSRLVEDLRTIANAEAGALDLRKELVDPSDLIREAAGAFDRKIDVDAADEMPLINLDPVRIREVLLNLLSNAVRHSEGAITVHAEMQPRRLVIRVIDTGRGIPPEELPRIFDRFHKGRDSHGSGLGLAIAQTLVKAHGGTIGVTSTVGRGTTVT